MSGIIGYIGNKRVVPVLLEGLQRLQYRGYDSAGIAVMKDSNLAIRRAMGKLRNLEEVVRLNPIDGTYGIGHTRWATERPRKKTPIRTAIATAQGWLSKTGSLKTTWS